MIRVHAASNVTPMTNIDSHGNFSPRKILKGEAVRVVSTAIKSNPTITTDEALLPKPTAAIRFGYITTVESSNVTHSTIPMWIKREAARSRLVTTGANEPNPQCGHSEEKDAVNRARPHPDRYADRDKADQDKKARNLLSVALGAHFNFPHYQRGAFACGRFAK
jgi:hypothetical protein